MLPYTDTRGNASNVCNALCAYFCCKIVYLRGRFHVAVLAEWLRRLTRNQIPSGSVGSSPTDCESGNFFYILVI